MAETHRRRSTMFECASYAPRRARQMVRSTLQQWELHVAIEDATLLVSELVTNALQHSDCEYLTVELRAESDGIRIAVWDPTPRLVPDTAPRISRAGGMGLRFVEELADRWGTEPASAGKWVWFRLRAHPAHGAADRCTAA